MSEKAEGLLISLCFVKAGSALRELPPGPSSGVIVNVGPNN